MVVDKNSLKDMKEVNYQDKVAGVISIYFL